MAIEPDRLPQPFRLIDKCLAEIIVRSLEIIDLREQERQLSAECQVQQTFDPDATKQQTAGFSTFNTDASGLLAVIGASRLEVSVLSTVEGSLHPLKLPTRQLNPPVIAVACGQVLGRQLVAVACAAGSIKCFSSGVSNPGSPATCTAQSPPCLVAEWHSPWGTEDCTVDLQLCPGDSYYMAVSCSSGRVAVLNIPSSALAAAAAMPATSTQTTAATSAGDAAATGATPRAASAAADAVEAEAASQNSGGNEAEEVSSSMPVAQMVQLLLIEPPAAPAAADGSVSAAGAAAVLTGQAPAGTNSSKVRLGQPAGLLWRAQERNQQQYCHGLYVWWPGSNFLQQYDINGSNSGSSSTNSSRTSGMREWLLPGAITAVTASSAAGKGGACSLAIALDNSALLIWDEHAGCCTGTVGGLPSPVVALAFIAGQPSQLLAATGCGQLFKLSGMKTAGQTIHIARQGLPSSHQVGMGEVAVRGGEQQQQQQQQQQHDQGKGIQLEKLQLPLLLQVQKLIAAAGSNLMLAACSATAAAVQVHGLPAWAHVDQADSAGSGNSHSGRMPGSSSSSSGVIGELTGGPPRLLVLDATCGRMIAELQPNNGVKFALTPAEVQHSAGGRGMSGGKRLMLSCAGSKLALGGVSLAAGAAADSTAKWSNIEVAAADLTLLNPDPSQPVIAQTTASGAAMPAAAAAPQIAGTAGMPTTAAAIKQPSSSSQPRAKESAAAKSGSRPTSATAAGPPKEAVAAPVEPMPASVSLPVATCVLLYDLQHVLQVTVARQQREQSLAAVTPAALALPLQNSTAVAVTCSRGGSSPGAHSSYVPLIGNRCVTEAGYGTESKITSAVTRVKARTCTGSVGAKQRQQLLQDSLHHLKQRLLKADSALLAVQ